MKYYPINLDLSGKKVLVIGGGEAAVQKIKGLLEAQADVFVIARKAVTEILNWAREKKLRFTERNYQRGDLAGAVLAFGTTLQPALNAQMREEALERGVWFNAVDQPEECDFTAPARVSRGELLLTVSTGGEAPFLSKLLRERL